MRRNLAHKNVVIPLISILLLGSLLRFYGLENQSLSNDELSAWTRSRYDDLSTVINSGVRPGVNPPGYLTFLHFVQKYMGDSESALRFPSAISGVLSIFVIYLLGVRLYSHREGLIASAFMAVFWCPIYYSQTARAYSMLLLFTLLATYLWISILESLTHHHGLSHYLMLGYIVSATVCSYLHHFGLYLIALQGLGAVLSFARRREGLARILIIYLVILIAYLPWLPAMVEDLLGGPTWIEPPAFGSFLHYLKFLFNDSSLLLVGVLILYWFLLRRGVYDLLKTTEYSKMRITILSPGLLLALWLVVPFAGAYVESILWIPTLAFRNLIISLPAAYLLLSRSITQLPVRAGYRAIITLVMVALFLSDLVFPMRYYWQPHNDQFREAVGFVVQHDNTHEGALIIAYVHNQDYLNYYFERGGSAKRVDIIAGEREDVPEVADLLSAQSPRYVWYIAHRDPDVEFIDFLTTALTVLDYHSFVGIEVWLFQNRHV